MTTNTEALREQFELYVNPEGDIKLHRLVDGSYAGHGLNQSWMDFQAGHAAGVAAERERCANLAADLSADACVAYANGGPMNFDGRIEQGALRRAGGALMTTPHPQAHLLRAIADGKQMQIKRSSEWRNCDASTALTRLASVAPHHIRIKPDTVTINGIECPAPMRAAPALHTRYFKPDPDQEKMYDICVWTDHDLDHSRFSLGLCFATAENAAAAARAMIAPLKGGAE